ncbi:MAG: hypothetical protein ABI134_35580 [Byssovorax sp.]
MIFRRSLLALVLPFALLAPVAGCAAFARFADAAVPVAAAAMSVLEASACQLHTTAGLGEDDARAGELHAAAAAVAARLGASTPAQAEELARALRAFEAAVEAVKTSLPPARAGGAGHASLLRLDSDAGPPDPDPDPSRPSPTLPLPPPAQAVALGATDEAP